MCSWVASRVGGLSRGSNPHIQFRWSIKSLRRLWTLGKVSRSGGLKNTLTVKRLTMARPLAGQLTTSLQKCKMHWLPGFARCIGFNMCLLDGFAQPFKPHNVLITWFCKMCWLQAVLLSWFCTIIKSCTIIQTNGPSRK